MSETYETFIGQFQVYDNPPWKKGYDRHHIVPESEQIKMYGSVTDNRQIYVTPAQHLWAHILYDREHGTKTAKRFLNLCGKSAEYFDCWEKCLAYSYTLRKKREEGIKKSSEACRTLEHRQKQSDSMREIWSNPERRQKQSDSMKGNINGKGHKCTDEWKRQQSERKKGNTYTKGRKWFNNSIISVMAFECPEGFVEGRLYQRGRT